MTPQNRQSPLLLKLYCVTIVPIEKNFHFTRQGEHVKKEKPIAKVTQSKTIKSRRKFKQFDQKILVFTPCCYVIEKNCVPFPLV